LKSARGCLVNILAPTLPIKNVGMRATILLYSEQSLLMQFFMPHALARYPLECYNLTSCRNSSRETPVQSYKQLKHNFPQNRNLKKGVTRKDFRTGIYIYYPGCLGMLIIIFWEPLGLP